MSASHIAMVKLHCDARDCGQVYEHIATHVGPVRELAAADGWRHRPMRFGTSNWMRSVDLCPACPDDAQLEPPRSERRRR